MVRPKRAHPPHDDAHSINNRAGQKSQGEAVLPASASVTVLPHTPGCLPRIPVCSEVLPYSACSPWHPCPCLRFHGPPTPQSGYPHGAAERTHRLPGRLIPAISKEFIKRVADGLPTVTDTLALLDNDMESVSVSLFYPLKK